MHEWPSCMFNIASYDCSGSMPLGGALADAVGLHTCPSPEAPLRTLNERDEAYPAGSEKHTSRRPAAVTGVTNSGLSATFLSAAQRRRDSLPG